MTDYPVQYNSSTLKAMYDSTNTKIMCAEPVDLCHDCGIITVTFSGVTECSSGCPEGWPSDLNTSFDLPWIKTGQDYLGACGGEVFSYQSKTSPPSSGWFIQFVCNDGTNIMCLFAYYKTGELGCESNVAFWLFEASQATVANNDLVVGDCGDSGPGWEETTGYGGSVSISYSDTGC